jgi:methyltransferase family protein
MATQLQTRLRNLRRGNLRLTNLHRSNVAIRAYALERSLFSRLGFQIVVKNFYSPIPDLHSIDVDVWQRRSKLAGIELDLDRQLEYLRKLSPYLSEFDPPEDVAGPQEYYSTNHSYGRGDADLLHAMARHHRPRRIVELGSGFTTLVLAAVMRENGSGELNVYDPYPGVAGPETRGVASFQPISAQDVPLSVFEELGAGDFLVVDTTHTVKISGDVNRIVLDVLPRLAPGVIVHFHDIFLPYEYPREWPERFGLYWTEQYLLQAFLALNPAYEVVCALHALFREHPEPVRDLIPALAAGGTPAAFWIRRRE